MLTVTRTSFSHDNGTLAIGALTRLSAAETSPLVAQHCPLTQFKTPGDHHIWSAAWATDTLQQAVAAKAYVVTLKNGIKNIDSHQADFLQGAAQALVLAGAPLGLDEQAEARIEGAGGEEPGAVGVEDGQCGLVVDRGGC